ncbi:MAG TPA: hypothetical protein VNT24_05330 [Propionibacteriaceae bacterium]|nr:hypothetical protein [Propionibacteriaceae bacterium]
MKIVGALVNPVGPAPEAETVTLLNVSPHDVDLGGWRIADRLKNQMMLPQQGSFPPETPCGYSCNSQRNSGTKAEAREGWTVQF